jgi:hypothetical protein
MKGEGFLEWELIFTMVFLEKDEKLNAFFFGFMMDFC